MDPDNINAFGMIVLAVFTIGAIYLFRTKPVKNIAWKMRVPAAFGGGLVTLIVWLFNTKRCLEIPQPFSHFYLTALCVMCFIIFIDKEIVLSIACALVLYSGVQLHEQFNELVRYSDGYVTIDANTHEVMTKGCSDRQSDANVRAENLWHTWFTGIYKAKKDVRE